MLRTRVGYAGGTTPHPTYHGMGDHSESVEITYDPSLLSYERLLELFWAGHDPGPESGGSRQYASIIFCHDEEQRRLAERSKAAEERRRGRPLSTEIAPVEAFTEAEDYHQKYYLQGSTSLMQAARTLLPSPRDLVRSTLAVRLNAAASGELSREELGLDLQALGMSPEQREALLEALPGGR